MHGTFPGALSFWRLTAEQLRALQPRLLVFSEQPADEGSRGSAYVIVDPDPGYLAYDRASDGQSEQTYRVSLRVCAHRVDQLLNSVDLVRATLRDFRPWPEARWSTASEEAAGPVIPDDSVPTDVRYSMTLTYTVEG